MKDRTCKRPFEGRPGGWAPVEAPGPLWVNGKKKVHWNPLTAGPDED